MSTDVIIYLKGILGLKGVELVTDFKGSVEQAVYELSDAKPDPNYVEHLLTPCLLMRLPGYQFTRSCSVVDDKVQFRCGSTSSFLRFIVGFCESMVLKYTIVGG